MVQPRSKNVCTFRDARSESMAEDWLLELGLPARFEVSICGVSALTPTDAEDLQVFHA